MVLNNQYTKLIQNKWKKFELREKILLGLCIAVILVFILYQLYYFFFSFNIEEQQEDLQNKQYVLSKIIPAVKKIDKIKSDSITYKKIPNANFIDFIKQDINSLNIKNLNNDVYKIHGGIVRVDIKEINFDKIISWLQNLNNVYGIKLIRANIERLNKKPGDVRFIVELEK